MTRSPDSRQEPNATEAQSQVERGYIAVTGAGGSVGPSLAAALLQRGWRVALITRPGKEDLALDKLADLVPAEAPTVAAFGADLDDEASARAAITAADERFGHPAALLNFAGGFAVRPATESGLDDVDTMMRKNFRSAVVATKAMLPTMRDRGAGFVLAVGAGAATQPAAGRTAYAAAKAALAAYFRSLSAELRGSGVGVAVLHPMGTIDTPPNRQAMPNADVSKWISTDAVVEAALYLMSASASLPSGAEPDDGNAAASGAASGRVPELELFPA